MIWVTLVAIICIAGLEGYALASGINGASFGLAIAAISGLGGYGVKARLAQREDKTKYVSELLGRAGYTETFIAQVISKIKGGG